MLSFVCFSQSELNGVVKFVTPPLYSVDTTSVKPIFRRISDGRLMQMTWAKLISFCVAGGASPLSAVLTAGNTAANDIYLTGEHHLRLGGSTTPNHVDFAYHDNLDITSDNEGFVFNNKNIGRSINGVNANYNGDFTITGLEIPGVLQDYKKETTFTYSGSNNSFSLDYTPATNAVLVFLNRSLLYNSEYSISGSVVTISSSLLTTGIPYTCTVSYQSNLSSPITTATTPKQITVATRAAMTALLPYDDPTVFVLYYIKSDEENGNVPSIEIHFDGALMYFAVGDE